jgi:hypothetical protein
MTSSFKIICGACKADAKILTQVGMEDQALCPSCGQQDSVDEALRIAKEHITESFKEQLNATLRDAAEGSKILKFKAGPKSHRTYRWHGVEVS